MNLKHELVRHLQDITGRQVRALPVSADRLATIPLYLRTYYDVMQVTLWGRRLLVSVQKDATKTATPSEYIRHCEQLRQLLTDDVALILPRMTAQMRRQLVRSGVPFVAPGRQMFLPSLLVDLRERFHRAPRRSERLSGAAQVVLLRYLETKRGQGVSLRELAGELGYSAMTMSNVRDELESMGLCASAMKGRSRHLLFDADRAGLWARALPHLRSPVKARHWIRWARRADDEVFQAGLTALAAVSMVGDNELPTCAVKESRYRSLMKDGAILDCAGPEEAQTGLECWRYDPALLSDGPAVDPLSLYLSLRETDDERVAKALKSMLGGMSW